jgi:hypothetical protein
MPSQFEMLKKSLNDALDERAKKRKKAKKPPTTLDKLDAAGGDPDAINGHADDDVGCLADDKDQLAKALQHAHAHGALTGAQACLLDTAARAGRLPANVRAALRAIDTGATA